VREKGDDSRRMTAFPTIDDSEILIKIMYQGFSSAGQRYIRNQIKFEGHSRCNNVLYGRFGGISKAI
jgi:hypothetical protein